MEVKEFVKKILKDVTEAVAESKQESLIYNFSLEKYEKSGIEFDLAIVTKKGVAEVFSYNEAQTHGDVSQETVSRIRFRIIPHVK